MEQQVISRFNDTLTASQKIIKIEEYKQQLERWKEFARIITELIADKKRGERNYRSLLHHIRRLFGIYKDQFQLVILNNQVGLLQVNLDYAMAEIAKLEKAVIEL